MKSIVHQAPPGLLQLAMIWGALSGTSVAAATKPEVYPAIDPASGSQPANLNHETPTSPKQARSREKTAAPAPTPAAPASIIGRRGDRKEATAPLTQKPSAYALLKKQNKLLQGEIRTLKRELHRLRKSENETTIRYDMVPKEHVESLVSRLDWVAQLLLSHQRAYDYRTLTLAQLKRTLEQLDTEALFQAKSRRRIRGSVAMATDSSAYHFTP